MYNRLMRLDKLLASSGYGTRSEVRKIISRGMVTVDGAVIRDISHQVTGSEDITINGGQASLTEYLYFILDKPDCVITAMEDSHQKCVGDMIPDSLRGKHLSPVGRLDYHTTGLLIITNDGELSHRLTSPKYRISKRYMVEYEGDALTSDIARELESGITLTDMDRPVKLAPCTMEIRDNNTCILTLTEGKTHEVRRIISHYGRTVKTLRRISVGPLELNETEPGMLRPMTSEEVQLLKGIT